MKTKGFEAQTYTQVPNSLFTLLSDMDESELKVVMILCRFTFGYHRDEVKLSSRALAELTGMTAVSVGIGAASAVDRGLIEKVTDGNKTTTWRVIVPEGDIVTNTPRISDYHAGDIVAISLSGVKERKKVKNKELSKEQINEVIKSANQTMDKLVELEQGHIQSWKGREVVPDYLLGYADWYNGVTNQIMSKRVQNSWLKALSEWREEGLTIAALNEALELSKKWRVISDPNQLTKDATAIHRAALSKPTPSSAPVYTPEPEPEFVPAPRKVSE